jgi:UDP-N-acetylmuramoyl-L-alanyl-D-glutamate--2,6-diaminopimelate ligase
MMAVHNRQQQVFSLGQLLAGMVVLSETESALAVTGLTIDSRHIEPGYAFVAMAGIHSHGKDFIEQALTAGAVAVLIDADEVLLGAPVPVIAIPSLVLVLSEIANRFYGQPSVAVPVVGITGTNGKTTCTQLLAQAMARLDCACGVMGTLGYGLISSSSVVADGSIAGSLRTTGMTTTDALTTQKICAELIDAGADALVMEVSSHGLIQQRVAAVAIDVAVFTNLSHDHLDYHGTMAAYGAAKAQLFAMNSVSVAVINQDDDFSATLLAGLRPSMRVATYSIREHASRSAQAEAHFYFKSVHVDDQSIAFVLVTPDGDFSTTTQLVGEFNLSNLLAVVTTLFMQGYSLADVVAVIPLLKPIDGRMEWVANQSNLHVVIDYAHTPDALKNALSALSLHSQGKLWCVFGCGGDRDREKRPQMASIAEQLADRVVVTSDNPRTESTAQIFEDIAQGFARSHEFIADRASAIDFAITEAQAGDSILIAGKGHENYQLIGKRSFPFSDQQQARLSLRQREAARASL